MLALVGYSLHDKLTTTVIAQLIGKEASSTIAAAPAATKAAEAVVTPTEH